MIHPKEISLLTPKSELVDWSEEAARSELVVGFEVVANIQQMNTPSRSSTLMHEVFF